MSLGLQIAIRRISLSADHAVYSYGSRDAAPGRVKLDLLSGNVELLEASEDETPTKSRFGRVAFKLRQHWRAGQVPETTWWAA